MDFDSSPSTIFTSPSVMLQNQFQQIRISHLLSYALEDISMQISILMASELITAQKDI